ncbi:hypothetical protein OEG84_10815 [Hoeflea sp. G2-23]|uniref:Uncharacterized protein n=1 Tax=Hoeflea algicola TaxID=2983763 RepID=A0ABT3Z8T0_9HYPH|nr:hypothetical protein [Hoeflea algicola]MCY0148190.1 hypothetical protein [Hoeflea algicola]
MRRKTREISVDLRHSRDELSQASARATRLSANLIALRAEKIDAEQTIEAKDASIRDLSADLHKREEEIINLTAELGVATRLAEARQHEIEHRNDQINRLGSEIEEMRIDLVTLDTEAENFKSQIRELRDERRALRETLKETEAANQDLSFRLNREETRLAEIEQKLATTITKLTDREDALDRRSADVERYKQKNKDMSNELRSVKRDLRDAQKTARAAGVPDKPERATTNERRVENASQPVLATSRDDNDVANNSDDEPADFEGADDIAEDLSEDEKIDRLRARQAALIERLMKANKSGNDAALRREIAAVAAMMVELTASRDGPASPIRKILKGSEEPNRASNSGPSLADRARQMLDASH